MTGDQLRDETRAAIEELLGFIETFLLVFAAISLFVGAFIITNTFAMSVRAAACGSSRSCGPSARPRRRSSRRS